MKKNTKPNICLDKINLKFFYLEKKYYLCPPHTSFIRAILIQVCSNFHSKIQPKTFRQPQCSPISQLPPYWTLESDLHCGKGTTPSRTVGSEAEIREPCAHCWGRKTHSFLLPGSEMFCVPLHPSLQTASPAMFLTPQLQVFHFPPVLFHWLISFISCKTMVCTKSFTLQSCFQHNEMQSQKSCLHTTTPTLLPISAFKGWTEHRPQERLKWSYTFYLFKDNVKISSSGTWKSPDHSAIICKQASFKPTPNLEEEQPNCSRNNL